MAKITVHNGHLCMTQKFTIQWNLSLLRTLLDLDLVLITEVSSIQRSLNTLHYSTGTQGGVLIIEISAIQRFVIERFHCSCFKALQVIRPLHIYVLNTVYVKQLSFI